MFERSLSSLINGLRSNKASQDQQAFLSTVLDEIRVEVKSGDMQVKSQAVLKMTYLQMLGHPIPAASFHILETMASPRYHLKHIGYLAAAQCFTQETDVLILATNMIKKDLHSTSPLDISVSLNGLSHIMTPDLASHLAPDVIALLSHTRAAIRKKAILVLYGVIVRFPDALEQAWDRLRAALDDSDKGVVGAAVNIVCELARRDAAPFVPLAPQLFHLLTNSTNNWMLIKLVKLFGALTPIEPRLVRKLLPPLTTIIQTTPAMSLLYECIHTLIIGGMLGSSINPNLDESLSEDYSTQTNSDSDSLARTCVDKLSHFLNDSDQNLKYISLRALEKLVSYHPVLVREQMEVVLLSLKDNDLSIRLRSLELATGMADRENLVLIVGKLKECISPSKDDDETSNLVGGGAANSLKAALMKKSKSTPQTILSSIQQGFFLPSYRLALVQRILYLTSFKTYSFVSDFDWLIELLVSLAENPDAFVESQEELSIGTKLREQIIDVTARVRAVRPTAIKELVKLIKNESWKWNASKDQLEVLGAVSWVCGEYCSEVASPPQVIPLLLSPSFTSLPSSSSTKSNSTSTSKVTPSPLVLCSLLHNSAKLFAYWAAKAGEEEEVWEHASEGNEGHSKNLIIKRREIIEEVRDVAKVLDGGCERLERSEEAEVQERAVEFRQLLTFLLKDLDNYLTQTKDSPAPSTPTPTLNSSRAIEFSVSNSEPSASSTDAVPPPPTSRLSVPRPRSLHLLSPLFLSHPLGPVGEKAQSKVPRPKNLELESWIIEPSSWELASGDLMDFGIDSDSDDDEDRIDFSINNKSALSKGKGKAKGNEKVESEAMRKSKEARIALESTSPFYLKSQSQSRSRSVSNSSQVHSSAQATSNLSSDEEPPLVQLSLDDIPALQALRRNQTTTGLPAATVKATAPVAPKTEFVMESEEMPTEGKKKKVGKKKVEKDGSGSGSAGGTEKEKEKKKKKKVAVKVED